MFLSYLGEDRGARIEITDSTFKHSSFCKGMIHYKKLKDIRGVDEPLFVNFTAHFERPESKFDVDAEPYIFIKDSKIVNIGFHEVVDRLTMKQNKTQANLVIADFFDYEFEVFKNRGLILNTQGFPGNIKVSNCQI